jgi:hypothetical protein
MAERKALALAGAVAVSAMSAAVAIGANFGLFGLASQPAPRVGTFIPAGLSEDAPQNGAQAPAQPASAEQSPALDDGPGPATEAPPTVTPVVPEVPATPALPTLTLPVQAAADDHRSSNSGRGSANSGHGSSRDDDHREDDDHRGGDDD